MQSTSSSQTLKTFLNRILHPKASARHEGPSDDGGRTPRADSCDANAGAALRGSVWAVAIRPRPAAADLRYG